MTKKDEKTLYNEVLEDVTAEAVNPEEETAAAPAEAPKISELTAQVEEYKDLYLRARADFENNKKRNATLAAKSYQDGKIDAIEKILPIGDNFDRALDAAKDNEAIRTGIELIKKQFEKALADLGVEEIEAEDKPFDPNFHNAVMQQPAEEGEEPGTVKTVLLKGYKTTDRVIRHSMVIVRE